LIDVAVAKSSKLGDVPLTPAQHATLRRHVERVQTTLRPQSKYRADVRHLFHKHESESHKTQSQSADENPKHHEDDMTHCASDVNMFVLLYGSIFKRNPFLLSAGCVNIETAAV